MFEGQSKNSFHPHKTWLKLSLTWKMLLIFMSIGFITWMGILFFQTKFVVNVFETHLLEELKEQGEQNHLNMSHYVQILSDSSKIIVSQSRFQQYIQKQQQTNWKDQNKLERINNIKVPQWLPLKLSTYSLPLPPIILLSDTQKQIRETYQTQNKPPINQFIEQLSLSPFRSNNESITLFKAFDKPYLIFGSSFRNHQNQVEAILTFIQPLDVTFLAAFQHQFPSRGILAFVDKSNNQILASSHPDVIPSGSPLQSFSANYIINKQPFLKGSGISTTLHLEFTTLLSRYSIAGMTRKILRASRFEAAFSIIGLLITLLLIMFWISKRLQNISVDIKAFADQQLNIQFPQMNKGDQLHNLEGFLKYFITELGESRFHLIEAKKKSEDANRAKSAFLARMSHEIRTPMNGVLGLIDLMLQGELEETQKKYALMIQRSGQTLISVINDILDFSSIEAGKINLEKIPFIPRDLFSDIIELFNEDAKNQGSRLSFEVSENVPKTLIGDPNRLNQILFNLVGNAIKFTKNGQIILKLEFKKSNLNKNLYQFEILDTGIGITKENQSLIFNLFSQADKSTHRKFGGTGLGLAITQNLVKTMGGELLVVSKINEGSCFYFEIELEGIDLSLQQDRNPKFSETITIQSINLPGNQAKILMVDDHKISQTQIMATLHPFGYQVFFADDGQAAIDAVKREPFDLIFMDCGLPIVSGYEATRKIRQIELENNLPHTPIIAFTAHVGEEVQKKCIASGMDDYLTKPLIIAELAHVLERFLGKDTHETPPPIESQQKSLVDSSRHPPGHILIVDDTMINRMVAVELFKNLGYTTSVANDGQEAVELYAREKFDLILMDCSMPVMNGYDATRAIRNFEQQQHLPRTIIIGWAATMISEISQKGTKSGMDDFLPKPCKQEQVKHVLDRWLNKNESIENIQ